ncbi:MAG: type II secretion system F family protein [Candidatus Aenigmarchaeota archaeon]|nr:type II secretion system F family protein [Candidatus Aenigmarchaeota archaeon]
MIYRLMPDRYKHAIHELLQNAGSKRTPQNFTNSTFMISLILAVVAGLVSGGIGLYVGLGAFAAAFGLLHGFLTLAVDRRAGFVESILPDALQLMAANSRAGYIPSRALTMSARKEFGPLSEAIKGAGKEMMTGKGLDESLAVIPRYIKSDVLAKTMKLIVEGIRSGGQFAELLEQNAEDIRRNQAIKKEIKANITMYIIFIGFAGCVGAPVLYALSSFLIVTIGALGASAQLPETVAAQVPFGDFSGVAISADFLFLFSLAAIAITTFFSGLIIGTISTGKEKAGIKFIPIFMVVGLGVFFAARVFISGIFGTLIPGG